MRVFARVLARVVALGAVLVAQFALAGAAAADPSASDWHRLRVCESGDDFTADTGNGYYGAYQFDLPTWDSVGGSGVPSTNPASEQDFRALYLYRMRGFQPWQCAGILGLREDVDAGSRRVPTGADAAYMAEGPLAPPPAGPAVAGRLWP